MKLKVKWDDRKFKSRLNNAIRTAEDKVGTLKAIAEQVRTDLEKHFDKEIDSSGAKWKPLSPATLASRRGGSNVKILQDTGKGSRMNIDISSSSVARVGSAADYMEDHNTGGTTSFGRKLPQREWAYVSQDGKRRVKLAIQYLIDQGYK